MKGWMGAAGAVVFFLLSGYQVARAELTEVRSIDGTGNHPFDLGAAGTPLRRADLAPATYPGDGSGDTIITPPVRENPRVISNAIASQQVRNIFNNRGMSNFVWQWGQFLDHDIDLTETSAETAPIAVPDGDLFTNPIPFHRSRFDPTTGDPGNAREQNNEITAFIDASNVYGSELTRAMDLRTGVGGKLDSRMVPTPAGVQELLPLDTSGRIFAGDIRADEQVGLSAMHTLFVREHNRLAAEILANNSTLDPIADDEVIYQKVRKIVGAQMQAITYNEFLPALLGPNAPEPNSLSYDDTVNPQIANEFSAATFRVGHTMLSSDFALVNNHGETVGNLQLRDAFGNPEFLEQATAGHANIDLLLRGLASTPAQEIDNKVIDDVRNFLFGPVGIDLASLNIQRGRDHGLPDYNTLRVACGLDAVDGFDDISSDPQVQAILDALYEGDVNNIDPWVGALAEDHLPGLSVGELINASLVDQFTRLGVADRFFYLNDPDLRHEDILAVAGDINGTRLSDIIERNTGVFGLQSNVFFVPEPTSWAMWILMAVGLAVFARHRRQKS